MYTFVYLTALLGSLSLVSATSSPITRRLLANDTLPSNQTAPNGPTFGKPEAVNPVVEESDPPLFSMPATSTQLFPNVHWSVDTGSHLNVIPLDAGIGSKLYYGSGDPSQAGHYGFMTYYFNAPSVNLDHCDHISRIACSDTGLAVSFSTIDAYVQAKLSWSHIAEGLIVLTYMEGCAGHSEGDRCYLKVTDLEFKDETQVVLLEGVSVTLIVLSLKVKLNGVGGHLDSTAHHIMENADLS
ncbi:hypothetical protein GGR58DRAFT_372492 [Xylaria digitata]|nr:hypothetical protein GGR58DRAFT_372492 [Xylaria digitata]